MNSNTISHQNQHEHSIENEANRLKVQASTASQQEDPVKQNEPFIQNGFFWNVNHSYKTKQNFSSPHFPQLDLAFEGQIYRKHLSVVKMSLKKYYQLFSKEDCSEQNGLEIINQTQDNMFTRPRDWNKACQNFINSLANSEYFQYGQLNNLSCLLRKDPLILNVFQIFGEAVPRKARTEFYQLLYHGLQLIQSLKQNNSLDKKSNMEVVDQKVSQMTQILMKYQNSEMCKEFLRIILYTSAMAGLGRGQNLFYEDLSKEQHAFEDTFQQTRFERQLNELTKDRPKKARLVRRNTLGNMTLEGLPKKRFNSIDP